MLIMFLKRDQFKLHKQKLNPHGHLHSKQDPERNCSYVIKNKLEILQHLNYYEETNAYKEKDNVAKRFIKIFLK